MKMAGVNGKAVANTTAFFVLSESIKNVMDDSIRKTKAIAIRTWATSQVF
ncbi:hypothetical protein [Metabacillus niabensis]|nr:hypothetical protein [Metabacillus niabensis]